MNLYLARPGSTLLQERLSILQQGRARSGQIHGFSEPARSQVGSNTHFSFTQDWVSKREDGSSPTLETRVGGLRPIPPPVHLHRISIRTHSKHRILESRDRTRQNRGEYLECRCQNRTGAAIVKIEFGRLSEFPEAADPPVSRSSRILKSCMILKYESDHKLDI